MDVQKIHISQTIAGLISRYISNDLLAEEKAQLLSWVQESPENEQLFLKLTSIPSHNSYQNELQQFDTAKALQKVKAQIFSTQPAHNIAEPTINSLPLPAKTRKTSTWIYASAAAVLLMISIGIWLLNNSQYENRYQQDVDPGTPTAILTLADGKQIKLDNLKTGQVTHQNGISISKNEDGSIAYHIEPQNLKGQSDSNPGYNTITTPKGGTYQVFLSDGTRIWLNAASSLQFPISFSADRRAVQLSGEAYFEVAKDAQKHFFVNTGKQVLEVLGTHFNVQAYKDEQLQTTTLLEGSVKLSTHDPSTVASSIVLRPGEQSVLQAQAFRVHSVEAEESVAWKNGNFSFDNQDLKSIMKELSRWYAVEVDDANLPKTNYTGVISRDVKLSTVLKYLERTGNVKFKIENRTIKIIN